MKKLIFILLLFVSSVSGQTYQRFGNTSIEFADITPSTSQTFLMTYSSHVYTASSGDIVDSLVVYVSASSSNDSVTVGIYDLSDSTPVYIDTVLIEGSTGWVQEPVTIDGSRTWELEDGTTYAIGFSPIQNTVLKNGFRSSGTRRAVSVFPNPWSTFDIQSAEYSLYAVYHNVPPASTVPTKFHKHSEEGNGVLHSSSGSSPRHKSE